MPSNKIATISNEIDEQSRNLAIRHSLQPQSNVSPSVHSVRRHNSLGKPRPTNLKKPSIPSIPESEKSDDDTTENNYSNSTPQTGESNRTSFTKTNRKVSNISRNSKISVQSQRNSSNYGYDTSTRSSVHGSMSSLPVIREQYCCCSRWTRLERNLALIVGVLALVIIGLIIAIGIVSNQDSEYEFPKNIFLKF